MVYNMIIELIRFIGVTIVFGGLFYANLILWATL